jgi:hypothetical protein
LIWTYLSVETGRVAVGRGFGWVSGGDGVARSQGTRLAAPASLMNRMSWPEFQTLQSGAHPRNRLSERLSSHRHAMPLGMPQRLYYIL